MVHCGSRQCGFQADAADLHVPPREGCHADGQEHHDAQGHPQNNPGLEKLLPHIRGNVGFVFTKEDPAEIRDMLLAKKVPSATCFGAIAPCEVTVPAKNIGLGPEKTSFFQDLGITTKISRGTIEILSDVQLIKTGDKVEASEATLLNMLNLSPFSFALIIQQVFDNGSIYNPEVLDITEETLHSPFLEVVRNVARLCPQIGYLTVASVPHSIINGYKRVLALSVETDHTFPLAEKVKAFLADPSAFVAAAPWPLPPVLHLLLPQPQPRLKQRKSQRNQMRIWDFVSLTYHQKQPIQPTLFVKQGNKGLLLFKKK